jgi:NCAIR mutase (PurE)-related protein
MIEDELHKLLKRVWAQKITAEEAFRSLRHFPFEDVPNARVDTQRELRCGFPEVILCEGKDPRDVRSIARAILRSSDILLATRADETAYEAILSVSRRAVYHDRARCVTVQKRRVDAQQGRILVVCAGTADVPVAEEAKVTATLMGHEVDTLYDVGVAGIHRLLAERQRLSEADVIVVVAGMEGALPSVIGGLSRVPVIGVPSSVGYGASFGGVAALLAMLNSCAAGVTVVNIDNGFGAAYAAALIARRRAPQAESVEA